MNEVELPYSPLPSATSRSDLRARVLLFVVWLVMFAQGLVYVTRYALINPYVDEWAFIPVLFGERPVGPWLWELHNEHRFPLPRLIYVGLFRLSGDLRAGCLVSFLGISLLAAGLVRLARSIRGRSHPADAAFPLLLMHTGQGENLYMGYQMAFMMTTALAGTLLAVIVSTSWGQNPASAPPRPAGAEAGFCPHASNHFRRGMQATILGWLLLTCGAAGLVYAVAAAAWIVLLIAFGRLSPGQRLTLGLLVPITPIYVAAYFHGYVRPSHHPPSAGVIESARIGLEAQAMAFGPAATGMWPYIGILILLVGLVVAFQTVYRAAGRGLDPRFAGLFLFVGAAAAVAFGIGWGRSGFIDDMGFAWRYGWITSPFVVATYFTWLLWGGRVATYGPAAVALMALVLAPVNIASGFLNGEKSIRPFQAAWEADVRVGKSAEEIVETHFKDYRGSAQREVIEAMRLMRDRRYAYYESLGREQP
jgi:hypothetical protein